MSASVRAAHTVSEPQPFPASERGALSGWEASCTCGARLATSLSARALQGDVAQHLAWHRRTPTRREIIREATS